MKREKNTSILLVTLVVMVSVFIVIGVVMLSDFPQPVSLMAPTAAPIPTPESMPTPGPAATAASEPTQAPRILSFSPSEEVSSSDKISVIVKNVIYTQGHSIDISLGITNNDSYNWVFSTFLGTVNGYGLTFYPSIQYPKVTVGSSRDVTVTAPLSPILDEIIDIEELQNVQLMIYVYPYERNGATQFSIECKTLENPDCPPDYVQNYPADDSPLYESKTFKASLARLDWDNRFVYLYLENLDRDAVYLTALYPAVNGYCSQNAVYEGYLPSNYGKTILAIDLSVITDQYDIDSLKRLALSGNQSMDLHVVPFNQYTFSILTEDEAIPEFDETGSILLDDDNVKIIYRGVESTCFGDGLNLLLINKTSDMPLFIPVQQELQCDNTPVYVNSDVIVAPNSACEITLNVRYSLSDSIQMNLLDKTISGYLIISTILSDKIKNVAEIQVDLHL